ncbi:MAG: hypothetical protein WC444_05935 [Candidatus Paceibacterota bacterium]
MDLGSLFFLVGVAYLLYLVLRYGSYTSAERAILNEDLSEDENMVYKPELVCEAEKVSFTCENPECQNKITAYVRDGEIVMQEGTNGNCAGELELECGKCCWLYRLDEYLEDDPVDEPADDVQVEEPVPAEEEPTARETKSQSKYM